MKAYQHSATVAQTGNYYLSGGTDIPPFNYDASLAHIN